MKRIQINENLIHKKTVATWIPESKSFRGAMFSGWLRLYSFKQITREKSFFIFMKHFQNNPCISLFS